MPWQGFQLEAPRGGFQPFPGPLFPNDSGIQLDPDNPVTHSDDPLIQESLQTGQAYLETFHYSSLVPGEANSLIYSFRVTSPKDGSPLGVLCLCFRFRDEGEGIFANLREQSDDWSIITLLDEKTALITYTSAVRQNDATSHARRSSIWSLTAAGWRLRFHQGTPCKS